MTFQARSGGLASNTNQSASWARMLARGASTQTDAVYYNPAGLAFLEDGLSVSLNSQTVWMKRTITSDLTTLNHSEFTGKLFVPVFPGVYAAYKTGDWTFSLGFNPPAGGGSVEFNKGLPMLENTVSLIPGLLTGMGLETTQYSMEAMMKGMSIVYGVQANATYKINDMLGVSAGVRISFASNAYEGYVRNIMINPIHPLLNPTGNMISAPGFFTTIGNEALAGATANQSLDVKQTGNGIAPILGVHYRNNGLNLAAKYEFRTKITLTNETKANAMNMYPDGQELRSDVPAILSLAGSYDVCKNVKISVTYLHHFEKQATFETWNAGANAGVGEIGQRQKLINGNTNEYKAGVEWKVNRRLTLSTGFQWSDVNVFDMWQNDIAHNLDNFTVGLGFAYRITDRLTLNFGAINTWYTSSSIQGVASLPGTPISFDYKQTYDRTNRAIAVGVDYRF